MTPEVIFVARHDAIELKKDGLPVPEPTIANGEENRWYTETPNQEVNCDIPARVNGPAVALEESEEEKKRVIEEGEENLQTAESFSGRVHNGPGGLGWMSCIAIDVSRGACEEHWRGGAGQAQGFPTYRRKR